MGDAPIRSKSDAAKDVDAGGVPGGNAGVPHCGEQFRTGADAGAAVAKSADGALEHGDLPAGLAQQMGGEQTADRAADHQRPLPHLALAPWLSHRPDLP